MTRNVIVTGGAGYIGSHTCKALAKAGFVPVTVDDLSTGHGWAVRWGPLERIDVRHVGRLDDVFGAYRPVGVLHFAARIEVAESRRRPLAYYTNNLGGLLSVLEVMARWHVGAFVFSSTAAVYGDPAQLPIPEDAAKIPGNPYGASKHSGERILADVAANGTLRYVALRYFNAAGADPDAEIGEAHDPETHLVPNAIRAALGKAPPLTVHGNDFDTPDGTAIRDYVHVSDLAEAHVAALRGLLDGGESRAFNVGTGAGHSVHQVMRCCERVLGKAPPHTVGPRRPSDPARLVAAVERIQRELNWRPRHSDLDRIVATAAQWHSQR